MATDVVVVDYGIGNLFSVRRAFEQCNVKVEVSNDNNVLKNAARLVLPGVGAFGDGMRGLVERGLDITIKEFAESGKPLLGICLGMQMLVSYSEEFGKHIGLDIIPGKVTSIPKFSDEGFPIKIPRVGWEDLYFIQHESSWHGSVLNGICPGSAIYLTHSYMVTPKNAKHRLAICNYNGLEVTTAIRKDNVYGVQFHPEKSGSVGLQIIKNFAYYN